MSNEFEMRIIEQLTEIRMEVSRLNSRIDRLRDTPVWENRV